MMNPPYSVGFDIGVTNVKTACVSCSGEVRLRESFQTRGESPEWPSRVRARLAELESRHGPAAAVGIAAPGVARADGASIRWMQGRLAEVQGLHWGEFLGRRAPVLNDAQAAILGEAWIGAARGATNCILLTLGTGVGGAAIVNGHLLRGHLGRAGHHGHICLDVRGEPDIVNTPGSLEAMIGDYTIATRSGGRFKTTHDLLDAYQRNNADARRTWDRSLDALACGIASLINVLDPEIVIIGGGIAVAGDVLFEPLRQRLRVVAWSLEGEQVPVVPATLGEYAGAIGAARYAMTQDQQEKQA
jgi:glucokinase